MTVLDNVKRAASNKGMTIKELSDKSGIKESIIYRWKTAIPNGELLGRIADILEVTTDYLLGRPDVSKMSDADLFDILSQPGANVAFDGKPVDKKTIEMVMQILRGME
jgi:transcriptional regulator with XRE-family HTH domain